MGGVNLYHAPSSALPNIPNVGRYIRDAPQYIDALSSFANISFKQVGIRNHHELQLSSNPHRSTYILSLNDDS